MTREMIIEQLERHRTEFSHDHGWNTSVLESLDAAIKVLKQEPCEDAISRQAVINSIANTNFWLSADNWKELMKAIDSVPSVQQTVCIAKISFDDQQMKEMIDKAISNFDFSDLISRQASIDAVCRWGCGNEKNGKLMITMAEAKQSIVDLLDDLPPVQLQQNIIRCKECRFYTNFQKGKPWNVSKKYCNRVVTIKTSPDDFCSFAKAKMFEPQESEEV